MNTQNSSLLTRAWKARGRLYEDLFGVPSYCLPRHNVPPVQPDPGFRRNEDTESGQPWSLFTSELAGQRITVNAYEPAEHRPYWMYLTSGLSNPWFQERPDDVSGFGCELMVKASRDARWPIRLLRRLSYYILSYSGTLSPGVILNMQMPLSSTSKSLLNNVFVWYADEAPDCWYQLPSGGFGIFCTVGITEEECQFAESVPDYGCWCIQEVLRKTGVGQLTNPGRDCVMHRDDIAAILNSVRNYADNFRSLT